MSEYQRALTTMGDSGVPWIDALFYWCVVVLADIAEFLGISYEALNIYLFVFLLPSSLLVSLVINIVLYRKCRDEMVKTCV